MPKLEYKLSIDTLITLVLAILSAGIVYGSLNEKVIAMDENGTKAQKILTQEMTLLRMEMVRLQTIMLEREKREDERDADKRQ